MIWYDKITVHVGGERASSRIPCSVGTHFSLVGVKREKGQRMLHKSLGEYTSERYIINSCGIRAHRRQAFGFFPPLSPKISIPLRHDLRIRVRSRSNPSVPLQMVPYLSRSPWDHTTWVQQNSKRKEKLCGVFYLSSSCYLCHCQCHGARLNLGLIRAGFTALIALTSAVTYHKVRYIIKSSEWGLPYSSLQIPHKTVTGFFSDLESDNASLWR